MPNGSRLRLLRTLLTVSFGVLALAEPFAIQVEAQEAALSGSPDQLAAAIARTMSATNPAASATSPIRQQVTSHDNIVETRVDFANAEAFAKAKASRNSLRLGLTRFMCKPERFSYLHKGVVFHYLDAGPDGTQPFGFVVDEAACLSLTSSARADDATLRAMSQSVAQHLQQALETGQATAGLRLKGVTAADMGIVVDYQVESPAALEAIQHRSLQMRGITAGWFCGEAGDAIRRGMRVDVDFKQPDGTSVFQIGIDRSVC